MQILFNYLFLWKLIVFTVNEHQNIIFSETHSLGSHSETHSLGLLCCCRLLLTLSKRICIKAHVQKKFAPPGKFCIVTDSSKAFFQPAEFLDRTTLLLRFKNLAEKIFLCQKDCHIWKPILKHACTPYVSIYMTEYWTPVRQLTNFAFALRVSVFLRQNLLW